MPNELTRLYRQQRGATAPSPDELIAIQNEQMRRAFSTRIEGTPVNMVEAVGKGLKEYSQGWKQSLQSRGRELQEMLGQDVAGPNEGMVSIPEAIRRRGTSPIVGLAAATMGPAGLPYLASPSVQREVDIGSQFMPTFATVELTGENVFKLMEDKLANAARNLATKYSKSADTTAIVEKLTDTGVTELTRIIQDAQKAGKIGPAGEALVDYKDLDEFFGEAIWPVLKKEVPGAAGEARPFTGLADEIDDAVELGEDFTEKAGSKAGLALKQLEQAENPAEAFERLAKGIEEAPIAAPAGTKNLIRGAEARSLAKKIYLQGESPTRAQIDIGKGTYRVVNPETAQATVIPTGNLQRRYTSPLKPIEGLDVSFLKPSVLLKKKGIVEDDILQAVDEVVAGGAKDLGLNRFARWAKIYLTEDVSPQKITQMMNRQSKKPLSQGEIKYIKNRLEIITGRVLERFGANRSVQDINNALKLID